MTKFKLILVITFLISLVGCEEEGNDSAVILLLGVSDHFDLVKTLEAKGFIDEEVALQIELMFLRKLILIRSTPLNVQNLNGQSLEPLCNLVTYAVISGFPQVAKNDPAIAKLAVDYALSIQNEVALEVNRVQKGMGGDGCNIGP